MTDPRMRASPATPIKAFPEALLALTFVGQSQTRAGPPKVILGAGVDTLRRFGRFLRFFDPSIDVFSCRRPPALSGSIDRSIPPDERRELFQALLCLLDRRPAVCLFPDDSLDSPAISPGQFRIRTVALAVGDEVDLTDLIEALVTAGYDRTPIVRDPGSFAVRGSLVDVFPPQDVLPARIDFDDVRIARIRAFDPATQESVPGAESDRPDLRLPPLSIFDQTAPDRFRSWIADCPLYHLTDDRDVHGPAAASSAPAWVDLSLFPVEGDGERMEEPALPPGVEAQVEWMRKHVEEGWKVALGLPADLSRRIGEFLKDKQIPFSECPRGRFPLGLPAGVAMIEGDLPGGLRDAARRILLLSAGDLFPRRRGLDDAAEAPTRGYASRSISDVLDLKEGDYVVHEQYGIGIFRGLKRIKTREEEGEYLSIEYRDRDILYVPLDKFHMVQKYIGSGRKPKPHRLGEAAWQRIKRSAREKIEVFARDLLGLYASREHQSGFAFSKDTVYQHEFEIRFPFEETPDQARAIGDVKQDMERAKPMDRLICGDAGFGKTEVALRAAFKATMDGKQVAVVVPTTLLAEQHRQVFEERFADFSVRIAELSRFRSRAEQQTILDQLKAGELDICIGTHRILQDDVVFRDLGLLIIDEEHRFGVRQKERLKFYRQFVDVLSMSATPIPRTLYMSLISARDISVIETPPRQRIPIHTEIYAYDPRLIREATVKEMIRGGQVFFLYNRVESIAKASERIRRAVPEARIGIAHGQMNEDDLSRVMTDFHHRRLDVLVTTTIIESGLDLPNANTIFIFDAEHFGLATLYQLRGRVGRSDRPAYCFLLTPEGGKPLTSTARRRLEAIAAITGAGGGYRVALEDLTLRGAGNLLGREQHGIVWEIGFEMYCDMLKSAIVELQGVRQEPPWNVRVDIKIPQFIPEDILPPASERIALYRRIARCRTIKDLRALEDALADRFGRPQPPPLDNLLRVRRLKLIARDYEITEVIEWNKSLSVYTDASDAVIVQTAKLRPVQLTPRQIEYNLRGLTGDIFLKKFVDLLDVSGNQQAR